MEVVALDCRMVRHSGIGTYLRNLLQSAAYRRIGERLLLLGDPGLLGGSAARVLEYRPPIYSLSEQWRIRAARRRAPWSLLHSPHYNLPLACPGPVVATVHDLIHWLFPAELPSRAAWLYARVFFRWGLRRAARVIADSECTRRDLVEKARFPEERIEVVPLAAGREFRPPERDRVEGFLERRGLPRDYFLYVGNLRPLKNVPLLVEAFRLADRKLGEAFHLLIAGRDDMPDWTGSLQVPRVRFLGEVPAEDLPLLYGGARVFVFPSLYEGFGLPPLEAMACGTPVIASRAGALPEVLGEAAVLVDPRSPGGLAAAMEEVATDTGKQAVLRQKGIERAAAFDWERTAERTLAVYRKVLG